MSTRFSGRGNLADKPVFKTADVNGESRELAELRIYFDRPVPNDDGEFADRGGFWLTGTLWGPRAKTTADLLEKGARIYCEGDLYRETWEQDGEERSEYRLRIDYVALDLARVERISWKQREERA